MRNTDVLIGLEALNADILRKLLYLGDGFGIIFFANGKPELMSKAARELLKYNEPDISNLLYDYPNEDFCPAISELLKGKTQRVHVPVSGHGHLPFSAMHWTENGHKLSLVLIGASSPPIMPIGEIKDAATQQVVVRYLRDNPGFADHLIALSQIIAKQRE